MILFLYGIAAIRISGAWADLPASMASHYGVQGSPDAWMGKAGFFALYFGFVTFTTAMLLAVPLVIPLVPEDMLSMPNKEYWLAPERRKETFDRMSASLSFFALSTTVFSIGVLELVIRANLGAGRLESGPFIVLLVGYLLVTLVWTIQLLRSFQPPET